jgi:mono/diheme cytochrome c family protein
MRGRREIGIGLGVALVVVMWLGGSPALAADAAALYKQHCQVCHGPEGKGDGETLKKVKAKAVDWTNKAEMAKLTDQYVMDIIAKGGGGVGKSKVMPGYKGKLSDDDVKALTAFVRARAK